MGVVAKRGGRFADSDAGRQVHRPAGALAIELDHDLSRRVGGRGAGAAAAGIAAERAATAGSASAAIVITIRLIKDIPPGGTLLAGPVGIFT